MCLFCHLPHLMYNCCNEGLNLCYCRVKGLTFILKNQHLFMRCFYFLLKLKYNKRSFTKNNNKRTPSFNSVSYSSHVLKDKCGEVLLPLCDTHWTKGGGEEQMQRWWWFPRNLCSRCHSSAPAGSWRCPRCTSGAGRTGCVFQTWSPGCCKEI